jgi:hypothetical protein
MPDLTPEILPRLRAHRLPGLDLGSEFIQPDYAGGSILNLPASICRVLGAPDFGAGPLHPEILAALQRASPPGRSIRRIVLVLMDALAFHRLQRWLAEGRTPIWSRLSQAGLLAPLTSIVPSTTSAAIPALWTGRSACEHGIVGYEMWLKEYGIVANTILLSPMAFQDEVDSLARAGLTPEAFLPFPTLGSHLAAHGIQTHAFVHHGILHTGLSRLLFEDVQVTSFHTTTDLWIGLRRFLESHLQERLFAWVYWGEVDHFSHFHGPDDESAAEEFASFSAHFERLFFDRLGEAARQDTLFLLTADHGQIATRPEPHYDLRNHPGLVRRLHLLPTGETRLAFLFIRPGQREAVREYLERTWPGQFTLLDPAYAVQAGLFGPGKPHPHLPDRLGDLLVAARGEAYLWWANFENRLIGRHGGLSPEEMLVPLLAASL